MCAPRRALIDLRQVAPDGIWSVIGVRGDVLTDLSFDVNGDGDATGLRIRSARDTEAPDGVLLYVAVTGVGACRGWESDSTHGPHMLLLGGTLPDAPADHPEGCDAVVLALLLPADTASPRNVGQMVLFGGGARPPILDALAASARLGPSNAAVTPPDGELDVECGGDIALDRNSVVAGRDGVHIVVANAILDAPTTFEISPARPGEVPVSDTDVRGGDRFDWTWSLAPGRYVATCRYVTTPGGDARSASLSFEVTDPNGVFVDPSLECEGGSIYEVHPPPIPDPSVQGGDPQGAVESHLEGLADDDIVKRAGGYPGQAPTIVTIERTGHVIGSVSFFETAGGSAFVDTIRGCGGTTFAWPDRGTPS
jgi:hypothetical protein